MNKYFEAIKTSKDNSLVYHKVIDANNLQVSY